MILYSDYPSLQAAINATPNGDTLQLPAHPIALTGPVTVSQNITIQGTNRVVSLVTVPLNQDGIIVTGTIQVNFRDFGMVGTLPSSAGALIRFEGGGGPAGGNSIFQNMLFDYHWDGLVIVSGSTSTIDGCQFNQQCHSCITVSGGEDNTIVNCLTATAQAGATGILYTGSGGGLRVNNTKCLGGIFSMLVEFASTMADGDLLITGCSFENSTYGFCVQGAPGAKFGNILLTGNEISASAYSVLTFPTTAGNWLTNVLLTGNVLYGAVSVGGVISGYSNIGNVQH